MEEYAVEINSSGERNQTLHMKLNGNQRPLTGIDFFERIYFANSLN